MHFPAIALVSISLIAGLLLSSCRSGSNQQADTEWWQLEGDRVSIAAKVELHQMRLGKHLAKVSRAEKIILEHQSTQARFRELTERAQQLRDELADTTEQIAALRLKVQRNRREASIGLELDSLVGRNGRDYKDVEITSVTDAGLVINHSSGIARLVAADLSKEQQIKFGIDSESSQSAIARESEKAVAYNRLVDRHDKVTRSKRELEKRKVAASRTRTSSKPHVVASTSTRSNNPLHQPARPVGRSSGYSWGYSGYNRYGTNYGSSYRSARSGRYSPPGPVTRFPVPGAGRRVNGTPAPRPSTPRPSPPRPCPND